MPNYGSDLLQAMAGTNPWPEAVQGIQQHLAQQLALQRQAEQDARQRQLDAIQLVERNQALKNQQLQYEEVKSRQNDLRLGQFSPDEDLPEDLARSSIAMGKPIRVLPTVEQGAQYGETDEGVPLYETKTTGQRYRRRQTAEERTAAEAKQRREAPLPPGFDKLPPAERYQEFVRRGIAEGAPATLFQDPKPEKEPRETFGEGKEMRLPTGETDEQGQPIYNTYLGRYGNLGTFQLFAIAADGQPTLVKEYKPGEQRPPGTPEAPQAATGAPAEGGPPPEGAPPTEAPSAPQPTDAQPTDEGPLQEVEVTGGLQGGPGPRPGTVWGTAGGVPPPPPEIAALYESAGRQYGIPPAVLQRQGWFESRYNPRAVGPPTRFGRASGIAQFIPSTAREQGLTDPMDPRQAIPAQAKFMRQLADQFGGDLSLALKGYNAGPGNARAGFPVTERYARNILQGVPNARLGPTGTQGRVPAVVARDEQPAPPTTKPGTLPRSILAGKETAQTAKSKDEAEAAARTTRQLDALKTLSDPLFTNKTGWAGAQERAKQLAAGKLPLGLGAGLDPVAAAYSSLIKGAAYALARAEEPGGRALSVPDIEAAAARFPVLGWDNATTAALKWAAVYDRFTALPPNLRNSVSRDFQNLTQQFQAALRQQQGGGAAPMPSEDFGPAPDEVSDEDWQRRR